MALNTPPCTRDGFNSCSPRSETFRESPRGRKWGTHRLLGQEALKVYSHKPALQRLPRLSHRFHFLPDHLRLERLTEALGTPIPGHQDCA